MELQTSSVFAGAPDAIYVALDVEKTAADSLTVKAGSITFLGETKTITNDAVISITPDNTYAKVVYGFIVKNKETGAVDILVDEILQDGVDHAYTFNDASPYACVFTLFVATILAKQTDFTVNAFKMIKDEPYVPRVRPRSQIPS